MFFSMGSKSQFTNAVNHFPQIVAALYAVLQFAKNLPDFGLNGVSTNRIGSELSEIEKKFVVDKVLKVIAGQCFVVVIKFFIIFFRRDIQGYITLLRPLHNPENFAVVTEKNFQMTFVARHFGKK